MRESLAHVTGTSGSEQGEGSRLRVITGVCTSVQSAVLDLADRILAANLTEDLNAGGRLLTATQAGRGQVRAHRLAMEGPAGLFEYLEENSAGLTASTEALRAEHEELEQCLEELEALLGHTADPASPLAEQIRRCATLLSCLMRRHRSSVDSGPRA